MPWGLRYPARLAQMHPRHALPAPPYGTSWAPYRE